MIKDMLTAEEAAERVGRSVVTLRNWRTRGTGPRYVRYLGKQPLYPVADLDAWIQAQVGESCPRCLASGAIEKNGRMTTCPDCKGNGRIA